MDGPAGDRYHLPLAAYLPGQHSLPLRSTAMVRFSTVAAAVIVWVSLSAASLVAQSVFGRITEQETGEPILGAKVTLLDAAGRTAATATTDRAGSWRLQAPQVGASYHLRVERVGYARIQTEAFLTGSRPVQLDLATRREVVTLEAVSTKALAYAGVLERAERRRSARTLLPDDVAERIRKVRPRNTGRLVAYMIGGLEMTWTGWPHFGSVTVASAGGFRRISCDAVVAVDGVPHFKDRPEAILDAIVPLSKVRAVEIFSDPIFLPSELRLNSKRNKADPPIECGVVAIWTEEGIALP
jgi:hypothetical protein